MENILDNPIWHALSTGNKQLAFGNDNAKYIKRDVGFFAGLHTNEEEKLKELHRLVPANETFYLFTPREINIPGDWQIQKNREILQMIYPLKEVIDNSKEEIVPLTDKYIPAMIELTSLTNPGPFLSRTIDYGNYEGIFNGEQLVAMAGQRLQPDPYIEVSAVCTHPAHTGRGYAARLIISQLNQIIERSGIPFLHVYPDNTSAIKLYYKLGFELRSKMMLYVINS